jgi:hypothetical protein
MAFRFRDLIVTLVPHDLKRSGVFLSGGGTVGSCTSECGGQCDSTSGGGGGTVGSCTSECGGQCDSTSGGGTVGSCTSECGGGIFTRCGLSDEILNPLTPIIDPEYMVELRLLLRHAIARSMVARLDAIEKQMTPRTAEDVDRLEKHLKEALAELQNLRRGMSQK